MSHPCLLKFRNRPAKIRASHTTGKAKPPSTWGAQEGGGDEDTAAEQAPAEGRMSIMKGTLCFHVECFIPHQLRQETISHTQPAGLLTGRRQRGTWTWATEIRKGTATSVRSQQNDNDLNVAAAAGQGEPTAGVHDANPTCWPHSHSMWF